MEVFNDAENKKRYLLWYLDHCPLKWPEYISVLELITTDSRLLNVVDFVAELGNEPFAIQCSARGTSTYPFYCRLDNQYYHDPQAIIDRLKTDPPPKIKVRLSFRPTECLVETCSCDEPEQDEEEWLIADTMDELVLYLDDWEKNKAILQAEIDAALDSNDHTILKKLVAQLKEYY